MERYLGEEEVMKCEDIHKLLSAYLDDEVNPAERKLIEDHLLTCEKCREELRLIASTREELRQALSTKADGVEPSIQVWSSIRQRIESKNSFWEQFSGILKKPVWLTATSVILVLIVIGALWRTGILPDSVLTPEKVLAKAQTALTSVQSYRTIDKAYDYDPSTKDMSLQVYQAETETDVTGGRFHFKKEGLSIGYFHEQIGIGKQVYTRGEASVTSTVEERQESTPSAILTQKQLDMLVKIEVLPDENIDGVACFHYRGTVDTEKFIQQQKARWKNIFQETLLQEFIDNVDKTWRSSKVTQEFWIGKDDYVIRQWKELITDVTGEVGDSAGMEIVKYYDFNVPIVIEAPLDESGALLPEWSVATVE